jgi:hypothetical protein
VIIEVDLEVDAADREERVPVSIDAFPKVNGVHIPANSDRSSRAAPS